jgi:hypothetical protein
MDTFDFIGLGLLCGMIGVGWLCRHRRVIRLAVVIILLGISGGAVITLATFGPRSAISQHEQAGQPVSKDFIEGAASATRFASSFYPYVLLATVGLALMAVSCREKCRNDGNPITPPKTDRD